MQIELLPGKLINETDYNKAITERAENKPLAASRTRQKVLVLPHIKIIPVYLQ